ncbi:MAG: SUMF1/EgtB/PvdO family nonheme iron enzyme [Magnetococcus sp. YQC-5]
MDVASPQKTDQAPRFVDELVSAARLEEKSHLIKVLESTNADLHDRLTKAEEERSLTLRLLEETQRASKPTPSKREWSKYREWPKGLIDRPWLALLFILLFAFGIRWYFMIGFADGDPQDDEIYLGLVRQILQNGVIDHLHQKHALSDPMLNPIFLFPSRIFFNYVVAFMARVLGLNDFGLSAFAMLCSLGGIVVVQRLGTLLFDRSTGLLAAVLLALLPLDILFAGRIATDVPVAFFMTVAIWLALKAILGQGLRWMILAGISIGLAYLIKEVSLITIVLILTCVLFMGGRKRWILSGLLLLGFALIWSLDGAYYYYQVGDFTFHSKILSRGYETKYSYELAPNLEVRHFGFMDLVYLKGTLFMQIMTMLSLFRHIPELTYFGFINYITLAALIVVAWSRSWQGWILLGWFVLTYLFLEFGPLELQWSSSAPFLTYHIIEKTPRYFTLISSVSVLVLAAAVLHTTPIRWKPWAVTALILAVTINMVMTVPNGSRYFLDRTHDTRRAAEWLTGVPEYPIFVDWLGENHLRYFSGDRLKQFRNINTLAQAAEEPGFVGGYAVIGGSRGGFGVVTLAFDQLYQKIPLNWAPLMSVKSPVKDAYRQRNLTIYWVPGRQPVTKVETAPPQECKMPSNILDIDKNGIMDATDGILILRYLNGASSMDTGVSLPAGQTSATITSNLNAITHRSVAIPTSGMTPSAASSSPSTPVGSMTSTSHDQPLTPAAPSESSISQLSETTIGCALPGRGSPSYTNTLDMTFKLIPSGTFMMGDPVSDATNWWYVGPQHSVTISKPFYMQTTEVTQGQWKAVMKKNPSYFSSCGEKCPVENISWHDVQKFLVAMNAKGEGSYRLPTEAEWEYAARAGTRTGYSFGDTVGMLGDYAWHAPNASAQTHPVGSRLPNPWGLYDMHGNVWEWVSDYLSPYKGDAVTDPSGPSRGFYRVIRGGSFIRTPDYLRSSTRFSSVQGGRYGGLGVRLVRNTEACDHQHSPVQHEKK